MAPPSIFCILLPINYSIVTWSLIYLISDSFNIQYYVWLLSTSPSRSLFRWSLILYLYRTSFWHVDVLYGLSFVYVFVIIYLIRCLNAFVRSSKFATLLLPIGRDLLIVRLSVSCLYIAEGVVEQSRTPELYIFHFSPRFVSCTRKSLLRCHYRRSWSRCCCYFLW